MVRGFENLALNLVLTDRKSMGMLIFLRNVSAESGSIAQTKEFRITNTR